MDTPIKDKSKIELIKDLVDLEAQLTRYAAIRKNLTLSRDDMIEVFGSNAYKTGLQGMDYKLSKVVRGIKDLRKRMEGMI